MSPSELFCQCNPQHVAEVMPYLMFPVMARAYEEKLGFTTCKPEQPALLGTSNGTIGCNICLPLSS